MQLRCPSVICSSGLASALLLVAVRAFGADVTPAPSSTPTAPPPATHDQVVQFLNAMAYELTPNSGKIVVEVIDASKILAYDPLAHYMAMPGGKTPTVRVAGSGSSSGGTLIYFGSSGGFRK